MNAVNATTDAVTTLDTQSANSFADLSGGDFFELLLAQISNQDPLEPVGNEELLNQIASIRDIEQSTALTTSLETLTGSLAALTGRQDFGAASALIGSYVTGMTRAEDGSTPAGVVTSVRFDTEGKAWLQLGDGSELDLERVTGVSSVQQAAEALVGFEVAGIDRRTPADPQLREGVVTAHRVTDDGQVLLELDTGEDLRLRDVLQAALPNA